MLKIQSPYQKRRIRFLEIWKQDGWTMKVYGITCKGEDLQEQLIDKAKELAGKILPLPAIQPYRYGFGFMGIHKGEGSTFVFIDWWSNENELNHHVYVASHESPEQFEYMTPTGLIACCWDLRVLSFERDCWVESILNPADGYPRPQKYLSMRLNGKF